MSDALTAAARDVRTLTPMQLRLFGLAALAYVKPVRFNGSAAFAIHAADGTLIGVAVDRVTACDAIRRHRMVPALVH